MKPSFTGNLFRYSNRRSGLAWRFAAITMAISLFPLAGATAPRPRMSCTLQLSDRSSDVSALQEKEYVLSKGYRTEIAVDYFDIQRALRRLHADLGIVSSGSLAATSWGVVGPAASAKLAQRAARPLVPVLVRSPRPVIAFLPTSATTADIGRTTEVLLAQVAYLQKLVASLPSAQQAFFPAPSTPAGRAPAISVQTGPHFTHTLSLGGGGDNVAALRRFLTTRGYHAAEPTGYVGALSEAAAHGYQRESGFDSSGSPSATRFGPRTRAVITASGTSTPQTTGLDEAVLAGIVPPSEVSASTEVYVYGRSNGTTASIATQPVPTGTSSISVLFDGRTVPGGAKAIEDAYIGLFRSALPGSEIYISAASWSTDMKHIADEVIAAHRRGVQVQIILSSRNENLADIFRMGLGASNVIECPSDSGCLGRNILHTKYMLFSALGDGATHIVVQSSRNMGSKIVANDFLVFKNNPVLYAGYLSTWRAAKDAAEKKLAGKIPTRTNVYPKPNQVTGNDGTRAYFFPRLVTDDPVKTILSKVDCSAGGNIRFMQLRFVNMGRGIARRLVELRNQGCSVGYIVDDGEVEPQEVEAYESGMDKAASLSSKNRAYRLMASNGILIYENANVHSKYFIIDAFYEGKRQKVIATGSHNINPTSLLHDDEAMVEIHNDAIYAEYKQDWGRVASASTLLNPQSGQPLPK